MSTKLFVLGLFSVLTATASQAVTRIEGTIERITDGDTVVILPTESRLSLLSIVQNHLMPEIDDKIRVRMVGIDAPESHLPTSGGVKAQGQFGERATEYMKRLIQVGDSVSLIDFGHDRYQRTLGIVELEDEDINLKMIEGGWAEPYFICSGPGCTPQFFQAQRVNDYMEAAAEARTKKKGIFDTRNPLKESPFEFRMRMQDRDPERWVGDIKTKKLYTPKNYKKVDLCRRVFFDKKADATKLGFKE